MMHFSTSASFESAANLIGRLITMERANQIAACILITIEGIFAELKYNVQIDGIYLIIMELRASSIQSKNVLFEIAAHCTHCLGDENCRNFKTKIIYD